MRRGRVEEASAVARRVGLMIEKVTKGHLRNVDDSSGLEELWKKVGLVTKRGKTHASASALSADELNDHYAKISEDPSYVQPEKKINRK